METNDELALLMAKDFVRMAQDYSFDTAVERISSRLIAARQAREEAEYETRVERSLKDVALELKEAAEQRCARVEAAHDALKCAVLNELAPDLAAKVIRALAHTEQNAVAAQEGAETHQKDSSRLESPASATAQYSAIGDCQAAEVEAYLGAGASLPAGTYRLARPVILSATAPDEALRLDEYKPEKGIWMLVSPGGNSWDGASPLECIRNEAEQRIPAAVRLARIKAACEPTAKDLADDEALRLEGMEQAQAIVYQHGAYSPAWIALQVEIARRKGPDGAG